MNACQDDSSLLCVRIVEIIGLTGGIASGKSTVRKMLRAGGAEVLDADAVYHDLLAPLSRRPSPLAKKIAAQFDGVLTPTGAIDRRGLGQRVFANPEARRKLEAITHPAVAREVRRRARALSRHGVSRIVYDVPLLYEAGIDRQCVGVIVVWVPGSIQLRRLIARDRISRRQAQARLAAQMPLGDKRRRATWVVDNSGSLVETRRQVRELWRLLAPPVRSTESGTHG
jgi:dephospho-CoA kinase